jgi:hypothetical protein
MECTFLRSHNTSNCLVEVVNKAGLIVFKMISFNMYSETCLNQTLNKPESLINQTLNKVPM